MNQVCLIGNLVRDPELKYTATNTAVCDLSVAVSKKFKRRDGSSEEKTSYLDCTAWGRTGEVINQYFRKGEKIAVTGELVQERWEDKQSGAKRSKVKINVFSFDFLAAGKDRDRQPEQPQAPAPRGHHVPVDESETPF